MATYTVDLFMTLDGFGSGPVGYWGKGGPELEERQARVFFGGEQETLVLGAGTYRLMAGFAAERGHDPAFDAITARDKVVISRTLHRDRLRRRSCSRRPRPLPARESQFTRRTIVS